MLFALLFAAAAILAGGVAAVTGFGIGSLLTPLLAVETGTKLAVAAVAIPHVVGSAFRFWKLRRHLDRRVLVGFGIASAVGGLAGALLHTRVSGTALSVVFGCLLILAAVAELTGWIQRVQWGRAAAWIAGALSGVLGGLVGNQGGIRSAAMLGFDVPKASFVATATAVALFVDAARLPVYLISDFREIAAIWPTVLASSAGVIIGTAAGTRVLGHLPERVFRRVLAILLIVLGLYMIAASSAAPRRITMLLRERLVRGDT
ncbi:MAG: sulfite exporter TauE/SafE family protein [Gemmatimonadaceae bacterium]